MFKFQIKHYTCGSQCVNVSTHFRPPTDLDRLLRRVLFEYHRKDSGLTARLSFIYKRARKPDSPRIRLCQKAVYFEAKARSARRITHASAPRWLLSKLRAIPFVSGDSSRASSRQMGLFHVPGNYDHLCLWSFWNVVHLYGVIAFLLHRRLTLNNT